MGIAQSMIGEPGMVVPERSEGERSEPSRSGGATIPAASPKRSGSAVPDREGGPKAVRRQCWAAPKGRILREADEGSAGDLAGLLHREGLYFCHLTTGRRQRESGEVAGLQPRKLLRCACEWPGRFR